MQRNLGLRSRQSSSPIPSGGSICSGCPATCRHISLEPVAKPDAGGDGLRHLDHWQYRRRLALLSHDQPRSRTKSRPQRHDADLRVVHCAYLCRAFRSSPVAGGGFGGPGYGRAPGMVGELCSLCPPICFPSLPSPALSASAACRARSAEFCSSCVRAISSN